MINVIKISVTMGQFWRAGEFEKKGFFSGSEFLRTQCPPPLFFSPLPLSAHTLKMLDSFDPHKSSLKESSSTVQDWVKKSEIFEESPWSEERREEVINQWRNFRVSLSRVEEDTKEVIFEVWKKVCCQACLQNSGLRVEDVWVDEF